MTSYYNKLNFGALLALILVAIAQVGSAAASSAKEEFDQLKDSCFSHHEGEGGLEEKCQKGLGLAEKVLKADPDNIEVLFKYSKLLDKADRVPEAIKVWQKIHTLDPSHAESIYWLVFRSDSMGMKKKAKLLKRVIKLNPEHPNAHRTLAVLSVYLGDGDKAVESMKKHIRLINKGINLPWIGSDVRTFVNEMGRQGFAQELPDVLIEYLGVFKGGELVCYDVKEAQERFSLKSKKLDESLKEFCDEEEQK